jgi:hypothetical protein
VKVLIETRGAPGPGGRPSVTRKTVTADWIRVGRNAACELHLPDPRVPLAQGMIVERDGLVYLEGESGSQEITRKTVHAVRLKVGAPIEIGPYRVEARPAPEGHDAAIVAELARPLERSSDLASRTSRLTLASLGLSKRAAAWTLGIAVLAGALVVPAGRVLHLPWSRVASETALGDRMWNPGPLLLAHQPIEQKCASCHEVAFRHVQDGACLECHRKTGRHVAARLEDAALFAGARCAGCHLDHKGVKAVFRDDDRFCVDCHRDLRAKAPGTGAGNASDFASDHPRFRVSIPAGDDVRRVRQDSAPLVRRSNLAFPHKAHLDPRGVRSPTRGRVRIDCAACHHPDASGRGFEPVSMARDCQDCHRLQFEPAVTAREVPHGKPSDAVMVIEEFYASLALKGTRDSFQKAFGVPGEGLLRRAGAAGEAQREDALRLADAKARTVARDLFEVRVCKTCHAVKREGTARAPAWSVAPVRTGARWMPHAQFDHRAHAASRCADCHAVSGSKSVDELALPTIDDCRKCHAGSRPEAKKVTSNCLLCHGFHDAAHPWNRPAPGRIALGR